MPSNAARSSRPILRVSVAASLISMPCQGVANLHQQPPEPAQRLVVSDPGSLDRDVRNRLATLRSKVESWDWIDLIERGRLAVADGDFAGGATVFEASLQRATESVQRLVSLHYLGRAMLHDAQIKSVPGEQERAARDRMLREAGDRLNQAQSYAPMSREIAAARVTAWSQAGDELETLAAEHQLRVIDPAMEGTARMGPVTAAIICFAVFKGTQMVLKYYDFGGHLKPEYRAALLQGMDIGVTATMLVPGAGAVLGAADLGIGIAEGIIAP